MLTKMMHITTLVMKNVRMVLYSHEYYNHSLSTANYVMTKKINVNDMAQFLLQQFLNLSYFSNRIIIIFR